MTAQVMAQNKPRKVLKSLILWGSIAYLAALCFVLHSLDHCTEAQSNWGALLYLPPEGWLLPLMILAPLALLLRPWVCIFHVAAAIVLYVGYLDTSKPILVNARSNDDELIVMTANLGQRNRKLLEPFIDAKNPDVIAFQEAVWGEKTFNAVYPDFDVRQEGEFTLASRVPIKNSGILDGLEFEGKPVAAWFEVEYAKQTVVIYSVHMPTPRTSLDTMRKTGVHGRFGLATDGEHGEFDYYWKARFELARGLLDALAQEKRPMIVVGDFNTPDHGELYKLFSSAMTDSFAAVGTGARATFPADVGGKLSELGPWLRLDYLFAGKGWMPIGCEVEPAVRAQHHAVMGRFQLGDAK